MGRQAVRPDSLSTGHERAFIALVPDEASLSRLSAYSGNIARAGGVLPDMEVRPYQPADLHMTLAFLGGIDRTQVSAILSTLSEMTEPLPTLTCIGEAWWPSTIKPRVHVIRYGLPQALKERFSQVSSLVRSLRLPIDNRPFQPHITLSRIHGVNSETQRSSAQAPLLPSAGLAHHERPLSDGRTSRTELNVRILHIGLFCKQPKPGRLRYLALDLFPLSNF